MNDENNIYDYDGEDSTFSETEDMDIWSVEESIDMDGNGIDDLYVTQYDFNEDTVIDAVLMEGDLNNDGYIDIVSYAEDSDFDGNVDILLTEADTNFDGATDFADARFISYEEDGSSTEYYATVADTDYDGDFDNVSFGTNDYSVEVPAYEEPADTITYTEPEEEITPPTYYEEPAEETSPVYYEEPAEETTPVYYEEPAEETTPVYYEEPDDGYNMVELDTDGDGDIDTVIETFDINGDGVEDIAVISADTDNDGAVDTVYYAGDTDLDGNIDSTVTYSDTDGDGVIDVAEAEYIAENEDGEMTRYFTRATDLDGDGRVDTTINTVDTGDDGIIDETESRYIIYNEDGGSREYFMRAGDLDGDGTSDDVDFGVDKYSAEENDERGINFFSEDNSENADNEETYSTDIDNEEYDNTGYETTDDTEYNNEYDNTGYETTDESTYDETDDTEYDNYDYDEYDNSDENSLILPVVDYDDTRDNATLYEELDRFDPADAGSEGIIGHPEDVLDLWECQGDTMRCAVYAQKFVIEEYTGTEVDIEELVDIAEQNGWFVEGWGTSTEDMDNLLEHYNIPHETSEGNTIEDLAESLNEGHKVIVSVDADEYWFGENDMYSPSDYTNHAIEVIGIDNSDPNNPMVIVNDSGVPDGAGLQIPMDTFMDAWEDGNNYMIECL